MKCALHLIAFLCVAVPAAATGLPDRLGPGDFHDFDSGRAEIGQLLFYDKILSGNRNISCGTCHHHDLHGTDGLSLGIGEGGEGVGPQRTAGIGEARIRKRIPRNAPALWNLGHKSIRVLFHDGRLEVSDLYGNGFNSPAQEWLPTGLDNILAAQAVLPLVAQFEMAGNPKENEIANALAAFIGTEWQSHDAPFDAWLAGDPNALSPAQDRGRQLFFGAAGCASCHAGPLFTDQEFHALGLPAFGPGRTRQWDPMPRDVGRVAESNRLEDAYRFRTPSLRNVTLTAPYGHNGAYPTLEAIVRHHLDPDKARAEWTPALAKLPDVPWLAEIDFVIRSDRLEMARQASKRDITPSSLSESEVADLLAFLGALTGATAEGPRPLGRPESVPSGLPVD